MVIQSSCIAYLNTLDYKKTILLILILIIYNNVTCGILSIIKPVVGVWVNFTCWWF